jgi:hypothetical protein
MHLSCEYFLLLVESLCYKLEGRRFESDEVNLFQFTKSFQLHYGPGVDSASNRNEYQAFSWGGKRQPARKAHSFTAICEPTV